jgi:Zn-dependent peptidase ImmA (M78 family)/DNA-binding XRE family transcriptional regulator
MDTKEVLGARLKQMREANGLSLRKMQEQLGSVVSHTQLSKYEDGRDMPSSPVLMQICTLFACSVDALFRPLHTRVEGIEFRKKSKLSKTSEKSIRCRVQDGVDRYFELEDLLGISSKPLEPKKLKCKSLEQAESAAEKVREKWELGENPVANVVELFEESQIKVQQVEADKSFDGCSGWGVAGEDRFPVIVLANWMSRDLARKRFTAAHELGHLVMDLSEMDEREAEKACHCFAGAFLLPKQAAFKQIGGRRRSRIEWRELAVLKQEYGISMKAVLYRLHALGIINDSFYKYMCIDYSKRGWNKHEPVLYAGAEECFRFRQLLYRGLAEEKISITKAAELSGKSLEVFQHDLAAEYMGAQS